MLDEIFYSECIYCKERIDYDKYICIDCLKLLPIVSYRCAVCGFPHKSQYERCRQCGEYRSIDRYYIPYYYSSIIKYVLKDIKFRYSVKGISFIKYLLMKVDMKIDRYDMIVPVPSHFSRIWRRFIHPVDIMSNYLSKRYSIPVKKILSRNRATNYQWKLNRSRRLLNIQGAFSLNDNVFHLKILLVDDIVTTGATVRECANLLIDNGASKVDCFILSKGVSK